MDGGGGHVQAASMSETAGAGYFTYRLSFRTLSTALLQSRYMPLLALDYIPARLLFPHQLPFGHSEMISQQAMKIYNVFRSILFFTLALPVLILVFFYGFSVSATPSFSLSNNLWICCKSICRKALERNHVFIPASHPHMHVRYPHVVLLSPH